MLDFKYSPVLHLKKPNLLKGISVQFQKEVLLNQCLNCIVFFPFTIILTLNCSFYLDNTRKRQHPFTEAKAGVNNGSYNWLGTEMF